MWPFLYTGKATEMKIVHSPQAILAALLILATLPARAVVGPAYHGQPDDGSGATPVPTKSDVASVDQIKGIGKYKFGAKLTDFANDSLQIVDPRAKGVLLKVSPYGDNYLVANLNGLTWGNIPLAGLILTFHDGILIDIQMALKAKKVDLYLADRAFKDKYGSNSIRNLPVETWSGDRIQVTILFVGMNITDASALEGSAQGKVELFDQARWDKFDADRKAKLNAALNKHYEEAAQKVKANL